LASFGEHHEQTEAINEANQHFVVSFGSMRTSIFKVLGGLSLSR
jgi:hypothetical protein